MKVTYRMTNGAPSVAYLGGDDEDAQVDRSETLRGFDKYSYQRVTVRLTEEGWVQVEA